MPTTTRDGLLEAWATAIETMEQNLETLYEPPQGTPTIPSVTTHEGLLEAIETEIKKAYVNYAKVYGAYHSNAYAYDITLPSNLMDYYGVKKVGGKTIVWNQVCSLTATTTTISGVTFTWTADGVLTTAGQASADLDRQKQTSFSFTTGNKYVLKGCPSGGSATTYCISINEGKDTGNGLLFTASSTGKKYLHFVVKNGTDVDGFVWNTQIFDLTTMFGAGSEPSTIEEFNAMFPAEYYVPSANTLMNVGVKDIVVKDGDTVKDTYTVPEEVQALTGYGMTCPNGTNYIDFEEKKFYQYVGTRAYAAGDESDDTVITDGTNTNYKLGASVETDISAYLTDVPAENVQAGWDIVFEYDDDYRIPVPVQVDYIGV